jgi:hypothetical protein
MWVTIQERLGYLGSPATTTLFEDNRVSSVIPVDSDSGLGPECTVAFLLFVWPVAGWVTFGFLQSCIENNIPLSGKGKVDPGRTLIYLLVGWAMNGEVVKVILEQRLDIRGNMMCAIQLC